MRFRLFPQHILESTQPFSCTKTIRQLSVPVAEPNLMSLDLDIICSGSLLVAEFNCATTDIIDMGVEAALWDAEFSGELTDAPGLEQFVEVIRVVELCS